jgi:TPR repeat protein
LAKKYRQEKNWKDYCSYLEKIDDLNPTEYDFLLELGNFYYFESAKESPDMQDKQKGEDYVKRAFGNGIDVSKVLDDIEMDKLKQNLRDPQAIFELAQKLKLKSDDYQTQQEAYLWLKKAADLGYPPALYEIAKTLYAKGEKSQAFSYFIQAAKQENLEAMIDLAILCFDDEHYHDIEESKVWFEKALPSGNERARLEYERRFNPDGRSKEKQRQFRRLDILKFLSFLIIAIVSIAFGSLLVGDSVHLSIFASISIVNLFFVFMFFKDFHKEDNHWHNLILGLGTLGTFLGILMAMTSFDQVTDESIKNMAKALRFVFVTSVLGLGTSIALRSLRSLFYAPSIDNDAYMRAFVHHLRLMRSSIEGIKDDWKEQSLQALKTNYALLLETMKENVRDVLGGNFKLFDEAMGKVVDFQKNYQGMLDSSLSKQADFSKNLEGINLIIDKQSDIQEKQKNEAALLNAALTKNLEGLNSINQTLLQMRDFAPQLDAYIDKAAAAHADLSANLSQTAASIKTIADSSGQMADAFVKKTDEDMQKLFAALKRQTDDLELMIKMILNIKPNG